MQQFWAFLIENEFMMKIDESVDHVKFNTEAAVKLFRINYLLHYCFPPSQIQPSGAPTRRHPPDSSHTWEAQPGEYLHTASALVLHPVNTLAAPNYMYDSLVSGRGGGCSQLHQQETTQG